MYNLFINSNMMYSKKLHSFERGVFIMKVNGKTVVVTGAGGGVGRELVLQLLEKQARVAAVDVNEESLNETKAIAGNSDRLSIHAIDLREEELVEELVEEVKRIHGSIDGVINNAGIVQPFININELTLDQVNRVMSVNFCGTLHMIKASLPSLLERPQAHIVNISSMGGFLPVPGQIAYGASKAAIKLLSEGLYVELKDTNVGVSVIIPGGIATDIVKNSDAGSREVSSDPEKTAKLLSPQKAASLIIKSMEKNKFRMFIGNDSKFLNILYKFAPKTAINLINKALSHN